MRPEDVFPGEMDPHSGIGDRDFERVLGGHGPSGDEELEKDRVSDSTGDKG